MVRVFLQKLSQILLKNLRTAVPQIVKVHNSQYFFYFTLELSFRFLGIRHLKQLFYKNSCLNAQTNSIQSLKEVEKNQKVVESDTLPDHTNI